MVIFPLTTGGWVIDHWYPLVDPPTTPNLGGDPPPLEAASCALLPGPPDVPWRVPKHWNPCWRHVETKIEAAWTILIWYKLNINHTHNIYIYTYTIYKPKVKPWKLGNHLDPPLYHASWAMDSGVWTLCRCSSTSLSPGEWLGTEKASHLPNCRGPWWQVAPSTHVVQVDQGVIVGYCWRVAAILKSFALAKCWTLTSCCFFWPSFGPRWLPKGNGPFSCGWHLPTGVKMLRGENLYQLRLIELRSSYIVLASAPSTWCMRRGP